MSDEESVEATSDRDVGIVGRVERLPGPGTQCSG